MLKASAGTTHLLCPCCGSLLPSTVSNAFALVNSAGVHVCGCALVSQRSLGMLHTSLPVPLSWDSQHLLVAVCVHLVRFGAVSHLVWLLPCINVFCASQLLVSLSGCQLEPYSPECEFEFTSVATRVFKCSHGNEGREQSTLVPVGLLLDCDTCAFTVYNYKVRTPWDKSSFKP